MAQIPRADPGLDCPLWQRPMEDVCHRCPWWMQLRGRDMNTGADVDRWGCSIGFLPMLLIENAGRTNQVAAAVESGRNEIMRAAQLAQQNREAQNAADDHSRRQHGLLRWGSKASRLFKV